MTKIRFGPSGNSQSFYDDGNKHSFEAPKWLNSKGLDAYEYSFGRGYTMTEISAKVIGEEAKKYDVKVSVHAPYYINFANTNHEMIVKSYGYIITGLKFLDYFNGNHLVVHIGSCGKDDRKVVLERIKNNLNNLFSTIDKTLLNNKYICLETMGKFQQIGTYEEIIDLCCLYDCLIPTFDFGHINALTKGGLKTEEDYEKIFNMSIQKLGFERTKYCHIHFSKIEYGVNGGEIRHLDFSDNIYGPNFEPLARVIKKLNLEPIVICESKQNMAEDALTMKNIYEHI